MSLLTLKMTLAECLKRYPFLKDRLYKYIGECVNCAGFQNEPLEEVLKAHRLNPEEVLKDLEEALREKESGRDIQGR